MFLQDKILQGTHLLKYLLLIVVFLIGNKTSSYAIDDIQNIYEQRRLLHYLNFDERKYLIQDHTKEIQKILSRVDGVSHIKHADIHEKELIFKAVMASVLIHHDQLASEHPKLTLPSTNDLADENRKHHFQILGFVEQIAEILTTNHVPDTKLYHSLLNLSGIDSATFERWFDEAKRKHQLLTRELREQLIAFKIEKIKSSNTYELRKHLPNEIMDGENPTVIFCKYYFNQGGAGDLSQEKWNHITRAINEESRKKGDKKTYLKNKILVQILILKGFHTNELFTKPFYRVLRECGVSLKEGPLLSEKRVDIEEKYFKPDFSTDGHFESGSEYNNNFYPKNILENIILESAGNIIGIDMNQWEQLYLAMWTYRNVFGVEKLHQNFQYIINIMKEAGRLFDPDFIIPANEYNREYDSLINPGGAVVNRELKESDTAIIFGSGRIYGKSKSRMRQGIDDVYLVDIMASADPDLVADMNRPEHLASLPNNRFVHVETEHIPAILYFGHSFFKTAARILKMNGTLHLDTVHQMDTGDYGDLYKINVEEYMKQFGFRKKSYNTYEKVRQNS